LLEGAVSSLGRLVWSRRASKQLAVVLIIGLCLIGVMLLDVLVWPTRNLAILYTVPVLIAALLAPPTIVFGTAIEAILIDVVDLYVAGDSWGTWPATVVALAIVCAFAVQLSKQRQEIARRAREAEVARRDAEDAHRQLRQFLGMISHELRQPLGVMTISLEIMQSDARPRESSPDRRALQMMERAVQNMERLVGDLLDAARIGSGRFGIRPEPVDLVAIASQVLQELQSTTDKHTLLLEAPESLEGQWDRQRLRQLLANLVSNAIKYSPDGGEVRLVIDRQPGEAIVRVSDQGIGISPKDLPQLFQPFSRLNPHAAANGTGLGLYISRAIVEAHQGRFAVSSDPGSGSTFEVAFPLLDHGQAPTRPPERPAAAPSATPILVASED
jgi:signal transduction histidine kinase